MKSIMCNVISCLIGTLIGFEIIALFMMASCTYNVSMAHTEGVATDTIDDTQSPQNTVSPNIDLPALKAG